MTTSQLLDSFSQKKVLVLGDVMIDAYLVGAANRISPEAPVPVVDVQERFYRLGGAANVALNLLALGATPILCSVVGHDQKATLFADLMKEKNLDSQYLVESMDRKTTTKYRVIGNKVQMLRIDEEDRQPLNETEEELFLKAVRRVLETQPIDAIVFEDYDKGVLSPSVIQTIVAWSKERNLVVTVDPKKRNFNHYQGVTLFKPNLKELKEGVENYDREFSMERVKKLMMDFSEANDIEMLFTTLSERGVALYDRARSLFYDEPAYLRKISDVSGAGDTVISVATLCLAAGLDSIATVRIANLAGGIVCEHSGVVPVPLPYLESEIEKYGIIQ